MYKYIKSELDTDTVNEVGLGVLWENASDQQEIIRTVQSELSSPEIIQVLQEELDEDEFKEIILNLAEYLLED